MYRRVLSLILAVQLLLTQSLLCRCGAAPEDHHGHARTAMPHIHTGRLLSHEGEETHRCGCHGTSHHREQGEEGQCQLLSPMPAENDQEAFCVDEVVATREQARKTASLQARPLFLSAVVSSAHSLLSSGVPPVIDPSPPFCGLFACPVYLQTLALLI